MQFPHEVFKAAGLGPTDVAGLFGVSRVTAHKWLRGANVHSMARVAIAARQQDVRKAVERNCLPLSDVFIGPARKAHIRDVLDSMRG